MKQRHQARRNFRFIVTRHRCAVVFIDSHVTSIALRKPPE
jgi:hypothetical protein